MFPLLCEVVVAAIAEGDGGVGEIQKLSMMNRVSESISCEGKLDTLRLCLWSVEG